MLLVGNEGINLKHVNNDVILNLVVVKNVINRGTFFNVLCQTYTLLF